MADSKWMQRLEGVLGEAAVRTHRRPALSLLVAAALTAVGGYFAYGLPLVADLEKLLPKTFPSVRDLEPVKERFGGIGYIVVVGLDAEPEQLKKFADEYAPKLEKDLPGIRYVDYQRAGRFFEERSLYYLSLEDLQEVAHRIKERERYERRQMNPMLVKLDEEEPPSLDMSDIEAKYGKRSDQRLASGGDYYLDEDQRMVVLLAKPEQIASDLNFSNKLVQDTEAYFAKQDLKRFGPNFHVGLTGTFKYKVDQQKQLSNDMAMASMLALALLVGYLIFHFRGVLPVFLVMVPVSVGLAWAYGITYFVFGGINILTGFLGAILGGLGTEHGIHLIGRYEVLRAEGVSSEDATRDAFMHTGGSAIVSSAVAALTFLSVAVSEFRAFREFGTIAAIGMMLVIVAYFLILPAGLGLATRLGWKPRAGAAVSGDHSELSRWLPRVFRPITIGVGLVLVGLVSQLGSVRFDYDFHALEDSSLPSFLLDREVNRILGYNMEPVVILTQKPESERLLVAELKKRQKEQGEHSTIDFVGALDELVPQQQEEKKALLSTINATLVKVDPERLDPATRPKFENLKRWVAAQPFGRDEIPQAVRRQFEGIKKSSTGFVLIFPNIVLSDGLQVQRFANEVRGIVLPNGESFSAAGEAMILADVLTMVQREARPILWGAILSVLLAMWLTLGSLRSALVCMLPTVVSLMALIGLMALLNWPFNYLNILLVPVFIGTTVDAGVHLISRLTEAGGSFRPVFAETGRAIVGGLITSGVGFGAMLMADHPGLNSLGRLANLGFAANLVVMLLWFPAFVLFLQSLKLMRSEPANAASAATSQTPGTENSK